MTVRIAVLVLATLAAGAACRAEEKAPLRATWSMPPRCDPFAPPRVKDLKEELRQTGYRLVIAIHPEAGSDFEKHQYPTSDLYIINADGTGLKPFTSTPDKEEHMPRTSPDGKWFTYNYGDYLVDVRTLKVRQVSGAYVWAPDSRRTVDCDKRGIVYTDMTTGQTSSPIAVEQRVGLADMTIDGKWFIFEIRNFRGSKYSVDFMSSEGGAIRKMPNHPEGGGECHPHFSPDGKWTCWNAGGSLGVRKFDPALPDGTDGKIITLPKEKIGQDPCGRWSHCGRYIAYVNIPANGSWKRHSPICIVRLADNETITLSPPGWIGHHWDYDWLPPAEE